MDVELDIIDDNKAEQDETVTFDLEARASGTLAPVHLSVTLTILDDEGSVLRLERGLKSGLCAALTCFN